MKSKLITCSGMLLAAGFLFTSSANAFNMGKMMNPSKWMKGGGNNDYDDDYYGGPGYPPPGYGYGGPGYGGYGGPGYGAYGAPGYGAPGYGGYGAPAYGGAPGYGGAPAYNAPQPGSSPDASEISRLKERIRVLEEGSREIPPPSSYGGQQGYQQPGYSGQPGYGGQQQPAYQQAPAPAYGNPNSQYRPLDRN
ncbi:MAG: hypothetical protein ABF290_07840 [Thiogranum sp.]